MGRLLCPDRLRLAGALTGPNEKAGAKGSGLRILPELGRSVAVTFFYGLVDIVLRRSCHEIIGRIAVQHKQLNFVRQGTKAAVIALSLLLGWPALAGSIVQPSKSDPLLDGGPTDPCAANADYSAGTDVNGKPVAQADVAGRRVPLPDSIAIPIGPSRTAASDRRRNFGRGRQSPVATDNASNRDSSYVVLDGRKLEPLLNPPPCGAVH